MNQGVECSADPLESDALGEAVVGGHESDDVVVGVEEGDVALAQGEEHGLDELHVLGDVEEPDAGLQPGGFQSEGEKLFQYGAGKEEDKNSKH